MWASRGRPCFSFSRPAVAIMAMMEVLCCPESVWRLWYVGCHLMRIAFGCVTYQVRLINLEQRMSTAESISPALTVAVRSVHLYTQCPKSQAPGLAKIAKWKATSLFCCVPQSLPEDLSQANYYTMWTVTLLMGLGSAGTSLGSWCSRDWP